jgi:hypothetical protein
MKNTLAGETNRCCTMPIMLKIGVALLTILTVPDELTFGQVLIQVGRANLGACALASGTKRPDALRSRKGPQVYTTTAFKDNFLAP